MSYGTDDIDLEIYIDELEPLPSRSDRLQELMELRDFAYKTLTWVDRQILKEYRNERQ